MDMVYDATDDRLVVATMGRGVWMLDNVAATVQAAPGVPAPAAWQSMAQPEANPSIDWAAYNAAYAALGLEIVEP